MATFAKTKALIGHHNAGSFTYELATVVLIGHKTAGAKSQTIKRARRSGLHLGGFKDIELLIGHKRHGAKE